MSDLESMAKVLIERANTAPFSQVEPGDVRTVAEGFLEQKAELSRLKEIAMLVIERARLMDGRNPCSGQPSPSFDHIDKNIVTTLAGLVEGQEE